MILTCPDCATKFTIKPEAIGSNGRTVRCSQCEATWFVAADPDILTLRDNEDAADMRENIINEPTQDEPIEIPDDENTADLDNDKGWRLADGDDVKEVVSGAVPHAMMREKAENKKVRRRLFGVGMIWGVTLLILALAILFAFLFRSHIVTKFPGAGKLYDAFGVEASASGLEIYDVESSYGDSDGTPILYINGKVRNYDRRTRDLPMIKLSFKNSNGEVLDSWVVQPERSALEEGQMLKFASEFPNPPIDAATLAPSFVDEDVVMETADVPMATQ